MNGKFSLLSSKIDYKGKINFENDFKDSMFIDIQSNLINQDHEIEFSKSKTVDNTLTCSACLNCNQPANGPYFFPCFHKPLCLDCFQTLNMKFCNICFLSIEQTLNSNLIESTEVCPVCHENSASKIVLPCCHRFCQQCLDNWHQDHHKRCMVCYQDADIVVNHPHYEFDC